LVTTDSLPPETDTASEPAEGSEWFFVLGAVMSVVYLVWVVVDPEHPLEQSQVWATASIALLAGACSCVVGALARRTLLFLAVAVVGQGLARVWGEDDLGHIWCGSVLLGASAVSVVLWVRRRSLR